MELVRPALEHVPSYLAARERGFSFDVDSSPEAVARMTAKIAADPAAFIDEVEDLTPNGRTITLPNGTQAPLLPQYTRWIWDGEFVGSIAFRWQPGTVELPDYVLGHIGYAVVEWKRRQGYATFALGQILKLPRQLGLPYVEVVTAEDNVASGQVVLNNGGRFVRTYLSPASQGAKPVNLYVIDLD